MPGMHHSAASRGKA